MLVHSGGVRAAGRRGVGLCRPRRAGNQDTAMAQTRTARAPVRELRTRPRGTRSRPSRFDRFRPIFRFLRRASLVFLALPLALRIIVATVLIIMLWSAVNWVYQVIRKLTELFFPVSGRLWKAFSETWRQYEPLF